VLVAICRCVYTKEAEYTVGKQQHIYNLDVKTKYQLIAINMLRIVINVY